MVEGTFIIQNKLGLHARAASQLAQLAMNFDAEIMLYQGDKSAQADSVLAPSSGMGDKRRFHAQPMTARVAKDDGRRIDFVRDGREIYGQEAFVWHFLLRLELIERTKAVNPQAWPRIDLAITRSGIDLLWIANPEAHRIF